MSDIKDEIDWEFPGANTTSAQTNYFWQGIIRTSHPAFYILFPLKQSVSLCTADQTQGQTHSGLSDTYSNYHDYTVSLGRM